MTLRLRSEPRNNPGSGDVVVKVAAVSLRRVGVSGSGLDVGNRAFRLQFSIANSS